MKILYEVYDELNTIVCLSLVETSTEFFVYSVIGNAMNQIKI